MKKIVALLITCILIFSFINVASEENPATSTDLGPIKDNYTINASNLSKFSIVALNNANLTGHIRGSIWIGGTLQGNCNVDDGSINHSGAGTSYVYNNQSTIAFKSRTSEQSQLVYHGLTDSAVTTTKDYWNNLITNLGSNGTTCIYIEPDDNGHADIIGWELPDGQYTANGSDEIEHVFNIVYWTDATSVTVAGTKGFIIAPKADVFVQSSNMCGSIVGKNITMSYAEIHINYTNPPFVGPTPTPSPTPTPKPVNLTVNKKLIGSVWHIRCDYMDGETFKAGGGFWRRDWIKNPNGTLSKEGHRSNKCGDADNWVIWVDPDGNPFRMDEIKSGATGGTLPTVIYKPSAEYPMSEEELREMGRTGDPNLVWKYNQQFQEVMDWSDIKIGVRMYWTTSNKGQVWYHTGIPYKVAAPTYTLYIDGEAYPLVANEGSVTLEDLQEGIHTISEQATKDTFISTILVNGIAVDPNTTEFLIDDNTVIEWVNELITPPPTTSPTPPPTTVVPTPTPTPTPSETPSPTPTPSPSETPTPSESPTPTPSESPTPTPRLYCSFTVKKVISNYEGMDTAIFFFKITGVGLEEPMYIEITVDPETGFGTYFVEDLKAGKYTVEEIDIPEGYELISEESITKYVKDDDMEFVFVNQIVPEPSPTTSPIPSETPTETPTATPTETPTETPTISPIPSETPTETPTEKPSETPSPIPSETPSPTPTKTPEPTESPTPRPSLPPEPLPSVTPTPIPVESPDPMIPTAVIGVRKIWNDAGNDAGRPTSLTITLYADEEQIRTFKLAESNQWMATIEVPLITAEGKDIHYKWEESAVVGYTLENEYIQNGITTFVNRVWERPVEYNQKGKKPKTAGRKTYEFDEYDTPLGVEIMINHVGDCFE